MVFEIEKLQQLHQRIESVCKKSGRNAEDIAVLAATKYADVELMNQVVGAGIRVIGENRIQDAQRKFPQLLPVRKHFIGTLQKNKVKVAVQLFDVIESVDDLELVRKINDESAKISKKMPILIEVNIAQDPQKHGCDPKSVFSLLSELKKLEFVKVNGLMTIVPFFENPEEARPYFRMMKVLFDFCRKDFPDLSVLSMGMSHDFEVAIEEGATEIRVGSFLFKFKIRISKIRYSLEKK